MQLEAKLPLHDLAACRKKSGKFEAKIFILCSKEGKMEDPLKRNFGLITWRGKNFLALRRPRLARPTIFDAVEMD